MGNFPRKKKKKLYGKVSKYGREIHFISGKKSIVSRKGKRFKRKKKR